MIKSYVGPMFSGKTNVALSAYKKIWNKKHVMCFKPKADTRDIGVIKSRDFEEGVEAICIDELDDIMDYLVPGTRTIFIDEAQFLGGNYQVLSYLSIVEDIDIHVCGLNLDANQKPFGLVPQILAISDEVVNIKAVCYDCNKEAAFTFIDEELTGFKVGDEGYVPLCRSCLLKRIGPEKLQDRMKLQLKRSFED